MEKCDIFILVIYRGTYEGQIIKEVASSVGYDNQMEFSKLFKKHFNITPTQWREKDVFQQSVNCYVKNQK